MNSPAPSDLVYMLFLPLAAFVVCAVITGKCASSLPDGARKMTLTVFFTYCSITLILFMCRFFDLGQTGDFFIHGLSAFLLVCVPFVYNLLVPDRTKKTQDAGWIPLIIPAAMVVPVFMGGKIFNILFLLLFYAGSGLLVYEIIRRNKNEDYTPETTGSFVGELVRQLIPVVGVTGDLIFQVGYQRIPVFSVICIVWLVLEICSQKIYKKTDHTVKNLSFVIAPVLLVAIILPFYGWLTDYLDMTKGAGFSETEKLPLIAGTVCLGGCLYYLLMFGMNAVYMRIHTYFTDSFSTALLKLEPYAEKDKIEEVITGYIFGVTVNFLYRVPFSNVFVTGADVGNPWDRDDAYYGTKVFFRDFVLRGCSLWTPSNIESYADKSRFYRDASASVESGDILFAAGERNVPSVLIVLSASDSYRFSKSVVLRILNLAVKVMPGLLEERKKLFADPEDIPSGIYISNSEKNLYTEVLNFLTLCFPVSHFGVYKPIPEGKSEVVFLMPENPDDGTVAEQLIEKALKERKAVFADTERSMIVFGFYTESETRIMLVWMNSEVFRYEEGIADKCTKLVSIIGSTLAKIHLAEEIEQNRLVTEKLYDRIESEKIKIAEELHDTVAQEIFASGLVLSLLEKRAKEHLPDSGDDIDNLKSAISEGLKKTREIISRLKNPTEETEETADDIFNDLRSFITRMQHNEKLEITVDNIERIKGMMPEKAREISFIVREGINNAKKHSEASLVRIRLYGSSLVIADNGKGFDPEEAAGRKSFGMENLRSRSIRLGSVLKIRTGRGRGTVIRITGF